MDGHYLADNKLGRTVHQDDPNKRLFSLAEEKVIMMPSGGRLDHRLGPWRRVFLSFGRRASGQSSKKLRILMALDKYGPHGQFSAEKSRRRLIKEGIWPGTNTAPPTVIFAETATGEQKKPTSERPTKANNQGDASASGLSSDESDPLTEPLTKSAIANLFSVGRNRANEILEKYRHVEVCGKYRLRIADMPPKYRAKYNP